MKQADESHAICACSLDAAPRCLEVFYPLEEGRVVEIHSIVSMPELNGMSGLLVGYSRKQQRWQVNIVENCSAIDLKVCEGDRGEIIMEDWTLDSSRVKREVRDWLKDAMSGPLMKTVLEVGQELWGCELKRLILSVGYKSTKHRQLLLNSTNLALLPTAQCGCLNSLNLRVHAIMRIGLTLYMCTRVQT